MKITRNKEDYLKALFYIIVESGEGKARTSQLADYLGLSPASVNNMLKKLRTKGLVNYEKYGKLELTEEGRTIAVSLIRKHRLWETFLCQHMNFSWDEVHEVAEQLEHVHSPKLIQELDRFLGFPKKDPHGAIIPSADGDYDLPVKITLADIKVGCKCRLTSVKDSSAAFLKYVSQIGLALSSEIVIEEIRGFDESILIGFNGKSENISRKFAENVFVEMI